MLKNMAAWLLAKHQPLQVGDAPFVEPAAGEILVRNRAVAINPVDWIIQYLGPMRSRGQSRPSSWARTSRAMSRPWAPASPA